MNTKSDVSKQMTYGDFLLIHTDQDPIKIVKFKPQYLGERRMPMERLKNKRKYTNGLYTVEQISRQTRGSK